MEPEGSPRSALLGRPEPRLFTPPARRLTRETTRGFEVERFADEVLGEPLLPWQSWLVRHALELNPDGTYRYRVILCLVARQSGKTRVLHTVSLWRMYLDRARLVLGAAQSLDIAREAWQACVDSSKAVPELADEVANVRHANGEQCLTLTNGARYRITAATRSAGRGLSVDQLNLDEIREQRDWAAWSALSKTTMARRNGQIWAISNAGDDESVVLNHLRETALSGRDPSIFLAEWSAPEGCDLDDPQAWAQANPGLGYTITEQAIRTALATDPPAVFRTEILCQRVPSLDEAVSLAAWKDCEDTVGSLESVRGRVVCCLDVAPDSAHVSLVAAALLDDGRVRLEVVAAWTSTEAARFELPDLLARVKPRAVAWYPGGPAAALATSLRAPKAVEIKGSAVAEACQGFADLVAARRVLHPGDPLMTAHVAGAQRLLQGDGWRFVRRGAGHVDCAYAAAGATHVALSLPAVGKPRIIVAS
ncbi:MAG TPA: hypothetical protein VF082_12660 [Jiangellaceae bacterium]